MNRRTNVLRVLAAAILPFAPLATGCGSEGPTGPNGELASTSQEIRGGSIEDFHPTTVYLRSAGCTGSLIARNVIMTARHCTPDAATGSFEVVRKLLSGWQCLSRSDGTYPSGSTNGVCGGARVTATIYRFSGPDTGDDIALLVSPTKTGADEWVNTTHSEFTLYLGSMADVKHQSMSGFGNNADNGTGAGELRYGAFSAEWWDGDHYVYRGNDSYQVCSGDSGAPLMVALAENWTTRVAFVGVHSSSDRKGACAESGSKQRGVRVGPKISWIRNVTGLACPQSTFANLSLANCW